MEANRKEEHANEFGLKAALSMQFVQINYQLISKHTEVFCLLEKQ